MTVHTPAVCPLRMRKAREKLRLSYRRLSYRINDTEFVEDCDRTLILKDLENGLELAHCESPLGRAIAEALEVTTEWLGNLSPIRRYEAVMATKEKYRC